MFTPYGHLLAGYGEIASHSLQTIRESSNRFTTRQLPEFLRDSARGKRTFVKMYENSSDRETTSGLIHIFNKSSQLPSDSEKFNILLQKAMLRNFSYIYIIENCSCEMKIKGNFSLHTKKKKYNICAKSAALSVIRIIIAKETGAVADTERCLCVFSFDDFAPRGRRSKRLAPDSDKRRIGDSSPFFSFRSSVS